MHAVVSKNESTFLCPIVNPPEYLVIRNEILEIWTRRTSVEENKNGPSFGRGHAVRRPSVEFSMNEIEKHLKNERCNESAMEIVRKPIG